MSFEKELEARSGSVCELCGATNELTGVEVNPARNGKADDYVLMCRVCSDQVLGAVAPDANHWRCLNDSMWSQVPAVQVVAWRMLNRLKGEGWPQDLLDMFYLDDDTLLWAKAAGDGADEDAIKHIDSNGNVLQNGDNVVLIKDLNVKGGGFTAKRGTAVRGIRLDPDNAEYIEGKVEGQQIVIITQYVKKMN
jgi:protein PhnA